MTPTLLDIKMLSGLDIISSANPFSLKIKCEHKLLTKNVGDGAVQRATSGKTDG